MNKYMKERLDNNFQNINYHINYYFILFSFSYLLYFKLMSHIKIGSNKSIIKSI